MSRLSGVLSEQLALAIEKQIHLQLHSNRVSFKLLKMKSGAKKINVPGAF
jgi:hypothetical protein